MSVNSIQLVTIAAAELTIKANAVQSYEDKTAAMAARIARMALYTYRQSAYLGTGWR